MNRITSKEPYYLANEPEVKTINLENIYDYILPENRKRFELDMKIRSSIFSPDTDVVKLPDCLYFGGKEKTFWDWYISHARKFVQFQPVGMFTGNENDTDSTMPKYTIDKPIVLMYSSGVESLVCYHSLYCPDIIKLDWERRQEDYPVPFPGTLEGLISIIGAGMGYAVTVVGMEGYSISDRVVNLYNVDNYNDLINVVSNLYQLEISGGFFANWNTYAYPASAQPILSVWSKEELVWKLKELGIEENIGSCIKKETEGEWCSECAECIRTYLLGKVCGIEFDIDIEKARPMINKMKDEYREFLETGFDPFANFHLFARIYEKYGVSLLDL